jgi:hypothetical protein
VRLWRLIKLVAGGGMLVVLGAAALMLWPLLWPPDPDASVQLVNGRLMGEATGYVGRIDRDARTVDVSASLVGWRPIVIAVNESTAILVQNRQGGFGDLWKDMPVRVSYEVVGERRLAKSIEVVTGEAESTRGTVNGAVTAPAAPGASPAPVVPPPAARAADPASTRAAPEPTPASAATPLPPTKPAAAVVEPPQRVEPPPVKPPMPAAEPPKRVEPPLAKQTPPVPEPPRRVEPPVAKPAPPPVPEPPKRVEPPLAKQTPPPVPEPPKRVEPPLAKPTPPPAVEPPRRAETAAPRVLAPRAEPEAASPPRSGSPSESDSGDGTAAIDWLLKGSRDR